MIGLFAELPSNRSDATDGERQTITQNVRAFLKWNPLRGFLDAISSHSMMVKDKNTQGMVPPHCISPGIPSLESMAPLLWDMCI